MGAGSTSLPCRDMGCDPSDAATYMCLADIAAEGRVPYTHALRMRASRLWLDWSLDWEPRLGQRAACEESSLTLDAVGELGLEGEERPEKWQR